MQRKKIKIPVYVILVYIVFIGLQTASFITAKAEGESIEIEYDAYEPLGQVYENYISDTANIAGVEGTVPVCSGSDDEDCIASGGYFTDKVCVAGSAKGQNCYGKEGKWSLNKCSSNGDSSCYGTNTATDYFAKNACVNNSTNCYGGNEASGEYSGPKCATNGENNCSAQSDNWAEGCTEGAGNCYGTGTGEYNTKNYHTDVLLTSETLTEQGTEILDEGITNSTKLICSYDYRPSECSRYNQVGCTATASMTTVRENCSATKHVNCTATSAYPALGQVCTFE